MICRNCGSDIPEGSLYCIHCGEKAEATQLMPQAQEAYLQPDAQYAYAPQEAPKKPFDKKKALIFGGGAVVLAVVLILCLTLTGGGGPLSGNTVQTKFVNENARFFTEMLGGIETVDLSRMLSGPFEYTMNVSTESNGYSTDEEFSMAYDRLALGIAVDSDYSDGALLLLEDCLYIESNGYVQVIEFDSEADLDKAMSLQDRIIALLTSGQTNVDYNKLIETFVNSIPEDCFEKTNSSFTLTLEADDMVDTLSAFAEKIETDEKLNEAFTDIIKEISGLRLSLSDVAELAADALDGADQNFELVWEIGYDNGAPASLTVSYEDASEYSNSVLEMEYENVSGGKEIAIELETAYGYSDFSVEMTTMNTPDGIDFEGDIDTANESISFEGYQKWDGENFTASIEADTGSGYSASLEQEGTISYSMPEKEVESDRRYEIDTDDAYYSDLSDLF